MRCRVGLFASAFVNGLLIGYWGIPYRVGLPDFDSSLLAQWTTTVGAILVAILAVWGDYFRNKLLAPKLYIDTESSRYTLMSMEDSDSWIINVRVKPRKWRYVRALDCRVFLWEIVRDGCDAMPVIHPFKWTPASTEPLKHSIGELGWEFALGRLIKSEQKFDPTEWLVSTPKNFNGYIGEGEAVIYGLRIFSDKYESKQSEFIKVSWNGKWTEIEAEMRQNLVLTHETRMRDSPIAPV